MNHLSLSAYEIGRPNRRVFPRLFGRLLQVMPLLPRQQQSAGDTMTDKNVWFVTGAGRGMGVDIVKSALAAGHAVVATGRNTDAVARALGAADQLLVVKLDVTRPE